MELLLNVFLLSTTISLPSEIRNRLFVFKRIRFSYQHAKIDISMNKLAKHETPGRLFPQPLRASLATVFMLRGVPSTIAGDAQLGAPHQQDATSTLTIA
jgi:hypothetical protein